MKDASLCDGLMKELSNDCGLSCNSKSKGEIRTSVYLEFVKQGESLPCRSSIWRLNFYMRAEERSAQCQERILHQ